MTTTEQQQQQQIEMLTADELATLTTARSIMRELGERLKQVGYTHGQPADAFWYGRASSHADHAEEAIFGILNTLSAYGIQRIGDEVVHDRTPVRPGASR